jgi:putative hemolysin
MGIRSLVAKLSFKPDVQPKSAHLTENPSDSPSFSLLAGDRSSDHHIVDLLIEERATGLMQRPWLWAMLKKALYPLLRYRDAVAIADRYGPMQGQAIFDDLANSLDLEISVRGAENIPRHGSALVVSNHPTGIADGLAVYCGLRDIRSDLSFLANRDALRVAPNLIDMLIPTEWVEEKRSLSKTREMMKHTKQAVEQQRLIGIFPSGRLAQLTHRGLVERPWLSSTIGLMRRFDLPILPLHISAKNSWQFYGLSILHPELRDITLFNELLNKRNARYDLAFGPLIQPSQLTGNPQSEIEVLRHYIEQQLPAGRPIKFREETRK